MFFVLYDHDHDTQYLYCYAVVQTRGVVQCGDGCFAVAEFLFQWRYPGKPWLRKNITSFNGRLLVPDAIPGNTLT